VLGHGFHPLKARQRRSIPNLQAVHRQGRIPAAVQNLTLVRGWWWPVADIGHTPRSRRSDGTLISLRLPIFTHSISPLFILM
jgi:hypothetical protein